MTLVGGVIGMAGAIAFGRAARSLLYGLEGHDPVVMILSAAVLTLVALAAAYIPAMKASRIDPMEALVDIRTLARVALESEDTAVMARDLEMILTIVDKALPSAPENPSEAIFGA